MYIFFDIGSPQEKMKENEARLAWGKIFKINSAQIRKKFDRKYEANLAYSYQLKIIRMYQ